jgi:hypothetical protein
MRIASLVLGLTMLTGCQEDPGWAHHVEQWHDDIAQTSTTFARNQWKVCAQPSNGGLMCFNNNPDSNVVLDFSDGLLHLKGEYAKNSVSIDAYRERVAERDAWMEATEVLSKHASKKDRELAGKAWDEMRVASMNSQIVRWEGN